MLESAAARAPIAAVARARRGSCRRVWPAVAVHGVIGAGRAVRARSALAARSPLLARRTIRARGAVGPRRARRPLAALGALARRAAGALVPCHCDVEALESLDHAARHTLAARRHERHDGAVLAGAAGTAGAVEVVLLVVGQV